MSKLRLMDNVAGRADPLGDYLLEDDPQSEIALLQEAMRQTGKGRFAGRNTSDGRMRLPAKEFVAFAKTLDLSLPELQPYVAEAIPVVSGTVDPADTEMLEMVVREEVAATLLEEMPEEKIGALFGTKNMKRYGGFDPGSAGDRGPDNPIMSEATRRDVLEFAGEQGARRRSKQLTDLGGSFLSGGPVEALGTLAGQAGQTFGGDQGEAGLSAAAAILGGLAAFLKKDPLKAAKALEQTGGGILRSITGNKALTASVDDLASAVMGKKTKQIQSSARALSETIRKNVLNDPKLAVGAAFQDEAAALAGAAAQVGGRHANKFAGLINPHSIPEPGFFGRMGGRAAGIGGALGIGGLYMIPSIAYEAYRSGSAPEAAQGAAPAGGDFADNVNRISQGTVEGRTQVADIVTGLREDVGDASKLKDDDDRKMWTAQLLQTLSDPGMDATRDLERTMVGMAAAMWAKSHMLEQAAQTNSEWGQFYRDFETRREQHGGPTGFFPLQMMGAMPNNELVKSALFVRNGINPQVERLNQPTGDGPMREDIDAMMTGE